MGYSDVIAVPNVEQLPRLLRQAGLVSVNQIAADCMQCSDNRSTAMLKKNASVSSQSFRSADRTIHVHVNDELILSIDAYPARGELVRRWAICCAVGLPVSTHTLPSPSKLSPLGPGQPGTSLVAFTSGRSFPHVLGEVEAENLSKGWQLRHEGYREAEDERGRVRRGRHARIDHEEIGVQDGHKVPGEGGAQH